MDGQSLLDQYPFPGQLSDPRELEQARNLALMRMGFGMMQREPIGQAIGHGINTYVTGEENARRNADQKMQEMAAKMKYAIEMNKEKLAAKKQAEMMGLIDSISKNKSVRDNFGITNEMIAYANATGDAAPIMKAMEGVKTSPGDVIMRGREPFVTRGKEGMTPFMFQGVEAGQIPQPGYAEEMARRQALLKGAETRNTYGNLGTGPNNVPLGFGYPPQSPAMVDQRVPPANVNIGGTGPEQAAATQAMDADRRMRAQYPNMGLSPAQQAQETELARMFGDVYAGTLKAELGAPASIAKYRRLGDLYSNVSTSKVYPAIAQVKSVAAGLFPEAAKNWTADLPPAQAAEAISRGMALELRNPASGMGMPGAMSDADREFLRSMVPNWELDPRSIPLMVEAKILLHEREMQVGKLARAYRKEHGVVDEGLIQVLSDYSEKNPLFDGLAKKAAKSPGVSRVDRYDKYGNLIP